MGTRRRGPPPPQIQVTEAHFRLLRVFGRNPNAKNMRKKEQDQLWAMMCQGANLPPVDRELTIDAWKRYVSGQSTHSSIAINGDIDPNFTTLGVSYGGAITAAHTTRTSKLLERVIKIWAKSFPSRDAFLNAAQGLCTNIADKVFGGGSS